MKRISAIGLCVALLACSRAGPKQPDQGNSAPGLHPDAVAQMEALIAEKEARTPTQRKISSRLLYAKYGMPHQTDIKGGALEPTNSLDEQGRWLVDLKAEVSPALLAKVEALGGSVMGASPGHNSIRARMPLATIEDLAADASVQRVRPAFEAATTRHDHPYGGDKFRTGTREQRIKAVQEAVRQARESGPQQSLIRNPIASSSLVGSTNVGAATSQGSRAEGADRARKFFNTNGTGVKVGVLSDSDDFKEQSIATGDLPADTVTVPGQDGRPGAGEGTAMMEIVHDVAPGAQLFFATAFNSPESFADNIRTLRFTYHCDVIVDDIIYFFEHPYQDDIIAQAVDDVVNDGAMYFSSAGNEGSFNQGTSGTYEGTFRSAGTLSTLPSGYTVHDFGDGVTGNRIELGGGPVILHWGNPGTLDNPQASDDYDLFVLTPDMRSVAVASTDIQDGNDLPFEFLGFNIPAEYRVVIAKKTGSNDVTIRTVIFGGEYGLSTNGATYGHSTAAGAQGVAAVDVALAGTGEFTGGPTTQAELYSSDGYRRILFAKDGTPLFGGNGETRIKPNFAAADGVSTTLPSGSGLNPFFGTSAAAPHAAGIAALMRQALPANPNWNLTTNMALSATDIMAAGGDRDTGSGIVNAFAALQAAGVPPAVFLDLGTVTTTPATGTAIVPGSGGSITVQLINNGGALARNVVATLTTTTPGVTVTGGSSSYPNIASGGSASNTTPFTFTTDSSLVCGQKITFNLSVTYRGATTPRTFSFPVQTGAPSAAVSTFSFTGPRVPIPDNNPAGANVPITVSGVGTVSNVTFSIDGTTCNTTIGSTTVGLDHTWVGDLVATLRSPSGTVVTLFSRAGGTGNSGNNFCQTVLTDAATNSIQTVTIAGAPFTGSFKPASPLAAFAGDSADGSWVLNVADLAAIDTGGVRAVSLNLKGFSCTP